MMSRPLVEPMCLRRAPLAAAAVWFALGILLAHVQALRLASVPTLMLLFALALLGLLLGAALLRAQRVGWVAAAATWVVLGVAGAEWQPAPPVPMQLVSYADNLSRQVRGRVVRVRELPKSAAADVNQRDADQVPAWEMTEESAGGGERRLSVDVAVDEVEDVTPDVSRMVAVSGGLRLGLYGDAGAAPLRCGDEVEVALRMKTPVRYRDPEAFQYADYLLAQGIAVQAGVAAGQVRVLGESGATLACRLSAAQVWASGRLLELADSPVMRRLPGVLRLNEADARMLGAMLFGDRSGLTHGLRVGFERTGTFHLFVVSGLHIALLAGGVFWALRRLRVAPWLATLGTLAAATAYAALTGFGQPSRRALVVTAVYLGARLLLRSRDSLNALGAAVLALLVWSPSSLFEASFQMTALVIVAIAGIAVPLGARSFVRYARATREVFQEERRPGEPRESQMIVMLEIWGEHLAALTGAWAKRLPAVLVRGVLLTLELALVGAVAELVMVLPMATYFHRAAVFGLPANMVVLPVVGLLAGSAVATFACSLAGPWLAVVPGVVTAALLHGVTWAIWRISHISSADVRVPGPVWWVAGLALLGWAGCCWAVRHSTRGAWATVVALPLIAALLLWPEPMRRTPGVLEVTAIDVGQGDSLLSVNPEGQAMLIDAGGPVGRSGAVEVVGSFDVGEEVVAPYLWSRRVRRVDVVVLSHAHSDHMGGMPAILEDLRPRELWVGIDPRSGFYAGLLAQAARLGTRVRHLRAGDHLDWGSVAVTVLAPGLAYGNAGAPKNDDSLVLRMDYGKASALFEGDAERPSEEAMLAAGRVQPVTLLKVGHHGSRTSSNPEFVAAAAPVDAVVSVGLHNTFGHPRAEVIERFAERGTRLFRTDKFGLTTFLLSRDGGIREVVGETPLPAHVQAMPPLASR